MTGAALRGAATIAAVITPGIQPAEISLVATALARGSEGIRALIPQIGDVEAAFQAALARGRQP